ncbi:MAG: damage-control phosphatase ARMT1 family protein [bacterium]
MNMGFKCYHCILRQVTEAIELTGTNESIAKDIINKFAELILETDNNQIAIALSGKIQKYMKEKTGVADPYKTIKEKNMKNILSSLDKIEAKIEQSEDPLYFALLMATIGNSFDVAMTLESDLESYIENGLEKGFIKDDYENFLSKLKNSDNMLFIADNCSEAIFDNVLIDYLNKYVNKIFFAVRSTAVLNDLNIEKAKEIGLDKKTILIESGATAPGMLIEEANKEFLNIYQNADIILSKGMGNFEGMSEEKKEIFFLLKAKCQKIADYLDVKKGSLVFTLFN